MPASSTTPAGVRDPRHRRVLVRLDAGRLRLAARLVRPRQCRDDVPRAGRQRQGAAGAAGPDVARRTFPARSLPACRPSFDRLAARRGGRVSTPPPQLLIDGKLVPASSGATYPILNPATGAEIGRAPDATAADVGAAIAAARRAFDETDWSTNVELPGPLPAPAAPGAAGPRRRLPGADHGRGRDAGVHADRRRLRRAGRGAGVGRRPGRVLRVRDRPRRRGAHGHPEPADRTP